jgi:cyclopropane-fatty-acyl-phospholipid synthase
MTQTFDDRGTDALATGDTSAARGLPAAPAYGIKAKIAARVLDRVLRKVPVTVRVAGRQRYGAPSEPASRRPVIEVTEPEPFFARLAASPMIGLGESFMAGEWRTGPGTDLADALAPFAERLTSLIKPSFYKMRHAVLPRGLNPENTLTGSRKNIEAHYDLSNDMFAQFLDPSLSYSSALFDRLAPAPTLKDLEAGQRRKVDAILDAADVTRGSRVLEVGTGWGTLAIRAAQRGAHVTTLTISREQAALAQARVDEAGLRHAVEIALRDYRDQDGEFDAIVSVEMLEAVGEKYWPTYFRSLESLLAPGGKIAVQTILLDHDRMLATRETYTWIH